VETFPSIRAPLFLQGGQLALYLGILICTDDDREWLASPLDQELPATKLGAFQQL